MTETPEQKSDNRAHRRVLIGIVAFVVLIIAAGIAYNALTPDDSPAGFAPSSEEGAAGTSAEASGGADTGSDGSTAGNGANGSGGAGSDGSTGSTSPSDSASGDGSANVNGSSSSSENAAPDFTMTDSRGQTVTLADFRGKPVLLNFWASWCGPCASEMPDIQAAYEQHGGDIQFLIVNLTDMDGETEQVAKAFIAQNRYTFPVYFDKDSSAATAYGVTSIPQTYLIDAQGNIIGAYMGAMDQTVLDQGIRMLQQS